MSDSHGVDFDVVVTGGSPTGLMLACELALAGVRMVLLELRDTASCWSDRVEIVRASSRDYRNLRAILLRPDGHIAWLMPSETGASSQGLKEALARWFGPESRKVG